MLKTKQEQQTPVIRARFAPIQPTSILEESHDVGTQIEHVYFRRGAVDGDEHALFKSPVHEMPTYYPWQRPLTPPKPTRHYMRQIDAHHEYMTNDMRRSPASPDLRSFGK